ncbi:uncharacterized protein LOC103822479 [Serinus canaria]|uniref:uncharacterized protein LOC103822479 n=1 Tax=Serinus canaria TaxID=9135 RepID=UPI0021CCAB77|nr:uncharacterized protein LOC103822479 [Serinus canaria]
MSGELNHKSNFSILGVGNAPSLMHASMVPAQAAGWITKVTSQTESSQVLSCLLLIALACMQEGHVYDFSQIHIFSCTEMTKNGILTIRGFCSREIFSITPIPHSNTSFSFPVQLIGKNNPKEMKTELFLKQESKIPLDQITASQAVLDDYKQLKGLDRGHLSPNGHHNSRESKTATFTLTNIVPQDSSLNQGQWNIYESITMPQKTQGCTTTYVITGAVPGKNSVAEGRVNRPSHIWSAACCLEGKKPSKTWGIIAENDKNEVENLSLGKLEEKLTNLYKRKVTLFNNACPRE